MSQTHVFTLRFDSDTAEKLTELAKSTHRSRAGVIRWLVSEAINNPPKERIKVEAVKVDNGR